jgi:hypothetical protein
MHRTRATLASVTVFVGHARYRFDSDGASPALSTCDGHGAGRWLRALAGGGRLGERRTVEGRPLNRLAGDSDSGNGGY